MDKAVRIMQDDLGAYRAELPNLVEKLTTDLTKSQTFLADKFDEIQRCMLILSTELRDIRKENEQLKQSLKALSQRTLNVAQAVNRQEATIDNEKRTELSSNAIVLGIPREENEDILDVVTKTCKTLGYHGVGGTIVSCSRIQGPNTDCSPIRVTFKNQQSKERLMAYKKNYGRLNTQMIEGIKLKSGPSRNVVIRDDLTPLAMDLLRELRQVQREKNLRFVWPGRNGIILVKHTEKSKVVMIRDRADLRRLLIEKN